MTIKEKIIAALTQSSDPQDAKIQYQIFNDYRNLIEYSQFRKYAEQVGIKVPDNQWKLARYSKQGKRQRPKTMFAHAVDFVVKKSHFTFPEISGYLKMKGFESDKAPFTLMQRLISEGYAMRIKRGNYQSFRNPQKMAA